jgi:hypothetical protein
MQILGRRSLAWVLKWVNDAAILFFAVILLWTLPFSVSQAFRSSYVVPDLPLFTPGLSAQGIEPITAEKEVVGVKVRAAAVTFRTERDLLTVVMGISGLAVWFGVAIWVLWLLRKILASLVAKEPLTHLNARRFRTIGVLIAALAAFTGLWRVSVYFYLQSHFVLPAFPGVIGLIMTHFPMSQFFLGLLILLMAEVMRLGAEHRVDSEAVI